MTIVGLRVQPSPYRDVGQNAVNWPRAYCLHCAKPLKPTDAYCPWCRKPR